MTRTRLLARAGAVALATTAMIGLAAQAAPAQTTPPTEPLPTFDFADCPARIPPAADPTRWRCEVLVAHGTVRVGRLPELPITRVKTTFAEGQLDGKHAQVFGAMRAEPVRVAGGLLGIPGSDERNPLLRLDIRLEYAGFADFLSVGNRMGEQHLKISVRSPLVPAGCTIGSDADPIKSKPLRTQGPTVVLPDPLTLRFEIKDTEFAVPGTHGCGPLRHLIERRFGVPSATANTMTLTTYVRMRSYAETP